MSIPGETGVTVPVFTVAKLLLAPQTPPEVRSLSTKFEPMQTVLAPVIVPAVGSIVIAIVLLAVSFPHELEAM